MKQYTAKIIVAAHKPYTMPDDEMYLPVHVGAAGKESIGYQRDDEGENISSLNPYFCELTGLYWAWKNLNEDYIGLVHYRRHFAMNGKTMEYEQLKPYLGKIKIFIPKKRWYVIETLQSHYEHTHYSEHIEKTRESILEKYPEYEKMFDKVLKQRWGYMFNMMIADNKRMKVFMHEKLKINRDKMVSLEIFDYLIENYDSHLLDERDLNKKSPVIIAGALSRHKAGYIYKLPENCQFNLYGINFEKEKASKNVNYVPNRSNSRVAKAPQSFWLDDIWGAHEKSLFEGENNCIDSCTMMQKYGFNLHLIDGPGENIKITTPEDFYTMRAILEAKENEQIYGFEEK